jgi:isopentenyl phosphate kinase
MKREGKEKEIEVIGFKLGGSDITAKHDPISSTFPHDIISVITGGIKYINVERIEKIARILKLNDVLDRDMNMNTDTDDASERRFIIVNGAGPFGHKMVEYGIHPRLVHLSVSYLNLVIRAIFEQEGLRVKEVAPFDFCKIVADRKEFDMRCLIDQVINILDRGLNPMSFGDVAPFINKDREFGVVSGDNILSAIGRDERINMSRMIMLSRHRVYNKEPRARSFKNVYPIGEIIVDEKTSFADKMCAMGIEFGLDAEDKSESMEGKARECYRFTQQTGKPAIIVTFENLPHVFRNRNEDKVGTIFTAAERGSYF